MRTLGGFCIALLCAGGLFAQHHSGAGAPGHASHGPSTVRWPYSGYYSPPARFHPSYFYPVFVGGLYEYPPYDYSDQSAAAQQQQPNVTVVYPQQPAPVTASPVIINVGTPPGQAGPSGPPAPSQSSYQEPAQQPDETAVEATHFLIALKDHTIYSAVAYWVDGSTLHYFTSGNTHNQISLSLVDRELTERLNKGSGLQVNLPPAK